MSDLPNGWVEISFKDVFNHFQYGLTAKAIKGIKGIKFLRITDIDNLKIGWDEVPSCDLTDTDKEKYRLLHGDFVFARSGSIEKACLIENPPEAIFASYLIRSRPVLDKTTDWIKWFIFSPLYLNQIRELASGIGLQNVNAQKLASIPLPLPPLNEQKRIVNKLDALMSRSRNAKEELDRIPKLVARYKQAVLAAAFRGDLTADWRGTSELAGWEYKKLNDIGYLGRGKSKHRPRNDPKLYGGIYPFIQTGDIAQSGGMIRNHSKTYSDFGLSQSKLWEEGTVCITIAANIADTAILAYPACFPDSVVGFICNKDQCLAQFIKWSIDVIKNDLESFAPATAQKNINLSILNEIKFHLPPLKEQELIVERIEEAFKSIEALFEEVAKAEKLRVRLEQATLAKAFRGELVPQDPNDEPASVLLERIRAEKAIQSKVTPRQKKQSKS